MGSNPDYVKAHPDEFPIQPQFEDVPFLTFIRELDIHKADYERMEKEIAKEQRVQKIKDAVANGTELDLSPNDIAEAKLYARMRAFAELPNSIDTLVAIRDDPNAKNADRSRAAESLINRAIGPAEAPNSIPFSTDQSSLVEALDAIKEG